MYFIKKKDLYFREKYNQTELDKIKLKFLITHLLQNKDVKKKVSRKILSIFINRNINKLHKKYSKTKIVRRCPMTGRGRGSLRHFGLSRIMLRDFLRFGVLPGYKKAIW
jgi:ribosomal protein S14